MCKSEIFAKILRIVSKETEVSEDLILSKCVFTTDYYSIFYR